MKGMIEAKAPTLRAQSKAELYTAVEQVCSNAGFPYSGDFSLADNAQLAWERGRDDATETDAAEAAEMVQRWNQQRIERGLVPLE